jgi:hypothetical protein
VRIHFEGGQNLTHNPLENTTAAIHHHSANFLWSETEIVNRDRGLTMTVCRLLTTFHHPFTTK